MQHKQDIYSQSEKEVAVGDSSYGQVSLYVKETNISKHCFLLILLSASTCTSTGSIMLSSLNHVQTVSYIFRFEWQSFIISCLIRKSDCNHYYSFSSSKLILWTPFGVFDPTSYEHHSSCSSFMGKTSSAVGSRFLRWFFSNSCCIRHDLFNMPWYSTRSAWLNLCIPMTSKGFIRDPFSRKHEVLQLKTSVFLSGLSVSDLDRLPPQTLSS